MEQTSSKIELPAEVREVLHEFFTAELTTIGKDGTPVTWPISVRYQENEGTFLLTSSIGYPGKIFNIRRNPQVSLSYSDPTGSGLSNPPLVLVQGFASLSDEVSTSVDGLEEYWRETIFKRQPASRMISSNAVMRWYADFYYMRYVITVDPIRVCWWPEGDYSGEMQSIEVTADVG